MYAKTFFNFFSSFSSAKLEHWRVWRRAWPDCRCKKFLWIVQWIKEIKNEKNNKKCPVIIERNNFQSEAQINFFFCLSSKVTRTNFVRRIRPFWLGVETEHLLLLLCSAGLCGPDPDPWRGVLCLSRSGIPDPYILYRQRKHEAQLILIVLSAKFANR